MRRKSVPGSRPNLRHNTTKPHMKDPRSMLDKHAAHIAADATIMNLSCTQVEVSIGTVRASRILAYSAAPDGGGGTGLCGLGL